MTAPRRSGGRIGWLLAAAILAGGAAAALWLAHPRAATVDVFFVQFDPTSHRGTLVPVRRPASSAEADGRLRAALEALLASPSSDERRRGIVSEVPGGTALRGVRIENGVVSVDLTAAFARGGGSASMLARVWQVVYTATQFREASQVQILLDGRRVEALGGEGVMIGRLLRRPQMLPTF